MALSFPEVRMLQCVASVLQCVAVRCRVLQYLESSPSPLLSRSTFVLQCVANVLQCVAVRCSVL